MGRHNALDKLIGALALNNVNAAQGFIARRWRGDVPLRTVFWRDMLGVGTAVNVLFTFAALIAATQGGLPLVSRPYEALGAMLGVPASQVQARLGDWQRSGRLLRMAVLPVLPAP